jgi:hydroxyethylthiazole kinase
LLAHARAVSASGPVDHVVSRVNGGTVLVKIGGGSALLPRVTATGCELCALVAAYTAVASDPLTGFISAHVHFSVAAELAEAVTSRPGSFAVAFVDALDAVDKAALRSRAKIHSAVLIE